MTASPQKPEELMARLVTKAWEDEAFKHALLKEPKAAIGRELGVELPDELEIDVVEESANRMCLVLPVRPQELPEGELSAEQLEAVAGGAGTVTVTLPDTVGYAGFSRFGYLTTTLIQRRSY